MNPYGSQASAPVPSLDRLTRGAHDALERLHLLHDVSLQKGDRDAAQRVGAMIAQLQDLDRRIRRIYIQ